MIPVISLLNVLILTLLISWFVAVLVKFELITVRGLVLMSLFAFGIFYIYEHVMEIQYRVDPYVDHFQEYLHDHILVHHV